LRYSGDGHYSPSTIIPTNAIAVDAAAAAAAAVKGLGSDLMQRAEIIVGQHSCTTVEIEVGVEGNP